MDVVTSSGNYRRYRQHFSECEGFRFPILGVHLKDLIAVHVALPDWADGAKSRVNLVKTQQLYSILQELALIQSTPPSIMERTDLLNLLMVPCTHRAIYTELQTPLIQSCLPAQGIDCSLSVNVLPAERIHELPSPWLR